MTSRTIFEIIGYVGSALVLLSFLMSSVLKLRIINSIGSFASLIYGLLVHTYPTVIMNGALLIINIVFIIKMFKSNDARIYHMHETDVKDNFLAYFIENHREDIAHFFKGFEFPSDKYNYAGMVYYKDTVIGIVLGIMNEDKTLDVWLDYTCPEYRDFSAGKHVYKQFGDEGLKKIIFKADPSGSIAYLEKMGFSKENDIFVKNY